MQIRQLHHERPADEKNAIDPRQLAQQAEDSEDKLAKSTLPAAERGHGDAVVLRVVPNLQLLASTGVREAHLEIGVPRVRPM